MDADEAPAIGIDLGTTNSCVAIMRYGKVKVIANDQGNFVTPSYVAFTDDEILIGDAAKKQVDSNPKNTVFDAKRMIGRTFDDKMLEKETQYWPFCVRDVDSEPRIQVMYQGKKKILAPEEISAMILTKMKEIAESYLNKEVKDAVITVPAFFNNAQRQATKDAAEIAGLNVLRILNEPTAAALAYKFNNREKFIDKPNILVFDLGGGTFDVSIMNGITNSVVASNGDTHLGGEDFDCRLVNFCVREFKKKYKIDLQGNRNTLRRLRSACEVAKRELSSANNTEVVLDALSNGIDLSMKISRARFEQLNSDYFKKTLEPIQAALDDAKLTKDDINIILLVGGSSRVPKIQELLQEFFNEKPADKTINPEEAVACGAAVYAALLKGDLSDEIYGKVLQDITPLSLGMDIRINNILTTDVVIPRNTPIPTVKKFFSHTRYDNQKCARFIIRQGESSTPDENHLLGQFDVFGLPDGAAGSVKFETVFEINADGILTVKSTEKSTGKTNGMVVNNVNRQARKRKFDQMVQNAKKIRLDEQMRMNAIGGKNALEKQCYKINNALLQTKSKINRLRQECDDALDWAKDNPNEKQKTYEKRYKDIISISQSTFGKIRNIFSTD